MRHVTLTVGTRASGKSTFCEQALALDPELCLMSRDKILIDLFGKTDLDPYTGGHHYAAEKLWEELEKKLASPTAKILLDMWNGDSRERSWIITKLRGLGAERIEAWYFITPVEQVEEWFWQKPGIAKMSSMRSNQGKGFSFYSEDAPKKDHAMFHQLASAIDSDGFDEVIRINPVVKKPEHVLKLQTSLIL